VENVVFLELYCEESVNPSLGPVNVLGEAIFFQLQGFDVGRVRCNLPGATRGSGEIRLPLEAGGACLEETVCNSGDQSFGVRATLWGFLDGAGEGVIPG